jgi:hypothetical protein
MHIESESKAAFRTYKIGSTMVLIKVGGAAKNIALQQRDRQEVNLG